MENPGQTNKPLLQTWVCLHVRSREHCAAPSKLVPLEWVRAERLKDSHGKLTKGPGCQGGGSPQGLPDATRIPASLGCPLLVFKNFTLKQLHGERPVAFGLSFPLQLFDSQTSYEWLCGPLEKAQKGTPVNTLCSNQRFHGGVRLLLMLRRAFTERESEQKERLSTH